MIRLFFPILASTFSVIPGFSIQYFIPTRTLTSVLQGQTLGETASVVVGMTLQ
jgi:hypothetical protein